MSGLVRDAYDVIVIGAGTGGLTAAALLARRGKSVLVLERHSVAGGAGTVFHRPGYQFDVGIHYLGHCSPDGAIPRILQAAGIEDQTFNELDPDGFDTLVFPDFTFRVPKGVERFRARLLEYFPDDARGIDRYLGVLQGIWGLQEAGFGGFRRLLRAARLARRAVRYLGAPLQRLLDDCTRDARLRAVLTGHNGDYAEPPSRAAVPVHALVTMSYLAGAYYPVGGAQAMSDRLAAAIERHGGTLRLSAPVTRILIDRHRAVGVEFESPELGRRVARAPAVISDADIKETLLELVGPAHLEPSTVARVRSYEMAPALGVVYLGVRRDLRVAGVPATNFWVHPGYDAEAAYAEARAGRFHPEPSCLISIATLKDPDNRRLAPPGVTNIELLAVVPSQPEAWGATAAEVTSEAYRHNPAYQASKGAFAARLIGLAERVFPGLGRDIVYQEVSSPLTHTRFTSATGGTSYGLALIPSQFLWRRPGHRTEIGGLFLCGASTYTGHGIPGVMRSGLLAASHVVGPALLREVMGPPPARAMPAGTRASPGPW
jgi:all-trans-retinol 13,14-reductase